MDPARTRVGVLYALLAFGAWGVAPVYFKAVSHVPALELLAHRIVWSIPVTALLVSAGRDWRRVRQALLDGQVAATLLLSATLVGFNWLVFIHAILTDRILHASLGYFINPLVNVLLGVFFLGERMSRMQMAAVVLAAAGTANLAWSLGALPWISIVLPVSFGIYGLLRKTVRVESVNGLFLETAALSPLAAGYLIFIAARGSGRFAVGDGRTTLLLLAAGLVTALPLVWFTSGARRLRYITIGFFQYIAPSLQFLLAVFFYGEVLTPTHMITFGCIWVGLAIFMLDLTRRESTS